MHLPFQRRRAPSSILASVRQQLGLQFFPKRIKCILSKNQNTVFGIEPYLPWDLTNFASPGFI